MMNAAATELAIITTNTDSNHRLSSKLEFVSASSSDVGATEQPEKLLPASVDKKVHWNCKYVQLLLDCVEARMHEFKNKSIHKKVWDDIGKEMQIFGFSTEHCYNKWKNLRRDVRMFAINPHKASKNVDTLQRVKRLISTICPNFDPTAVYKKATSTTKSPHKQSEESSNSLEPLTKLLTPPTSPFSEALSPINNENMEITDMEAETDVTAIGNGDARLNLDSDAAVYSYLIKQQQQHNSAALLFQRNIAPNLFLDTEKEAHKPSQCLQQKQQDNSFNCNNNSKNNCNNNNSKNSCNNNKNCNCNKKARLEEDGDGRNAASYASWPYELYDLLVSFRTEEAKQAHSIEQLIRQIHEIRDSSVRRMNTIQQLMNLANLLISSKIS